MPSPKKDKESLTFKEFVSTCVWSITTVWLMMPGLTTLYIISTVLIALMSFVSNFITARVLDIIVQVSQGDLDSVWIYYSVGMFFASSMFSYLFRLGSDYSDRMINSYVFPKFQENLYKKMDELGIETLEQPDINNLISRIQQNWRNFYSNFQIVISIVSRGVSIITGGLIVYYFMPSIIPFLLIVIIPYIYFDRKYTRLIWRKDKELTESRRGAYDSMGYLTDSKTLHELTITGGRGLLEKKFIDFRDYWYNFLAKERLRFFRQLFVLRIMREGILAYADFTVISRFVNKTISIGDVTFYLRTISGFSSDINGFSSSLTSLYESSLRVAEIKDFFEIERIHKEGDKNLGKLAKGPEVSFKDVSFKYPNSSKLVIKNLNLKIRSEDKIAIVGHNGAGKTTLVKLICGFYQPSSGVIEVNGINLQDIKKKSLYKNMGVLFQEFNEYHHLTAKQNVHIGKIRNKINLAKIRDAAKKADAHDFIEDFENKYDQILSEKYKGGVRPSTGMWQKIAIARFFYRNAPLVIFDEPTAAIDAEAEAKIFNKIYSFFKGKTVIIISHRFSTVRNADRIIVFEKGQIIEQGSHEELMKLKGKYSHAFNLQAEGYK